MKADYLLMLSTKHYRERRRLNEYTTNNRRHDGLTKSAKLDLDDIEVVYQ
jgi:hypothetical protein